MAKFSKKTYVVVAASLKKTRDSYAPHWDPNLFRAMDDAAKNLAAEFALDNPRFDRAKFLKAAGVQS